MQTQASNQSSDQAGKIITSGNSQSQSVQVSDSRSHSVNQISIPIHETSCSEISQQHTEGLLDSNVTDNKTSQFITVTVPDGNQEEGIVSFQSNENVHSAYVQYVDGVNESSLYTTNNSQMTNYPSYTIIGSTSTPYYSTNGNSFTYSQIDTQGATVETQTPVINNQGCISGNVSNGDNHIGACASPTTVQWLIDNYETAEGVSLPRSTLYNHYLRHCSENKLEPINAASFGKLIRSVFLGLRTRRLGTRGNSKYHYYGIRIKASSNLNQLSEVGSVALRQKSISPMRRCKQHSMKSEQFDNSTDSRQQSYQHYLGDSSTVIPVFPEIDVGSIVQKGRIKEEEIHKFLSLYKEHYEDILDAVVNLQFTRIEHIWQTFWQMNDYKERSFGLDKNKLYILCKEELIISFIRQTDYLFYQNLVDVLIPNVLRPVPGILTQSIRNFAKNVEVWLTTALADCPEEIVKIKVGAVCAFSQILRRYTSLNHLAQAARAVLQNSSQIHQMMTDLNRVDFHNVQEQASWICQCNEDIIEWIQQDFKNTLQQQNSLEQWAGWLENVVNVVLQPYENKSDFSKAARQFLLKWSFYSSMIIRDLTLRSAASFGSFHLIRLLFDEYMFYLIEHKVAKITGETSVAVMGELIGLTLAPFNNFQKNANLIEKSKYPNGVDELEMTKLCKEKSPASTCDSSGMKEVLNQSILAHLLNHSQEISSKKVKIE
ncbi:transcription factor RFX3-like [Centruroides sculpturatus]|uniref:transcription factor RFX3-like n=1 Tax=Centruroides sculpturatus TaxID=218467 RepID=UPI000C6D88D5|nr:transcription factor RFX3-like [Centruroides sculpturatus]